MSLMRTGTEAVITVAMRMHWPPDGSSTDLELTGAGPHHMPYDQLRAVDDQRTHYAVRFEGGRDTTATWLGFARLSPVPPHDARRLDLIGDGTRLIHLPLGPPAPPGRQSTPQRPNGWPSSPVNACSHWKPNTVGQRYRTPRRADASRGPRRVRAAGLRPP